MNEEASLDGGDAVLQAARDLGADYIFSSAGSEWAPVWEALARGDAARSAGAAAPAGGPRYLAVSTTALYGHPHCETPAATYLRGLTPIGRTSTYLIFDLAPTGAVTAAAPRL